MENTICPSNHRRILAQSIRNISIVKETIQTNSHLVLFSNIQPFLKGLKGENKNETMEIAATTTTTITDSFPFDSSFDLIQLQDEGNGYFVPTIDISTTVRT